MFRNMPIVDVYLAAMPLDAPIGDVECKARREEINSVSNERVKREKYFVWKLLCYALERSFGMRGKKLELKKESYGGWSAGDIYVSLSHSNGALAVAVSRAPVGVDIEHVHSPRSERIAEHIMSAAELAEYERTPAEEKEERLVEIWTAKEAIFKSKMIASFIPNQNDTLSETFKTSRITFGDTKYAWSVATDTPNRVRVFDNIDLATTK